MASARDISTFSPDDKSFTEISVPVDLSTSFNVYARSASPRFGLGNSYGRLALANISLISSQGGGPFFFKNSSSLRNVSPSTLSSERRNLLNLFFVHLT